MNHEYKILVVDDSDDNREMVALMLQANGYEVDKACNGVEALQKLAGRAPDLFLLDVSMPQMGGLELLGKISVKDNAYEAIMMTGNESLSDAKKAMELGAFSYVAKPLQWEELDGHLQRALSLVKVKKERLRHLAALEEEIRKRNDELQTTVQILESQSKRLDAIINSMGEGLLALDNKNQIVLMNAQSEKILGIRFGQCAGETLVSLNIDPDIIGKVIAHTSKKYSNAPGENIMTIMVKGYGMRSYHVNTQEIADNDGAFIGRVITFLDCTDKIKADQLRTSFLSVVAHELRTPLTIIQNYLAILKGIENNEAVADMKIASKRLGHLVGSLISLASLSDASIAAKQFSTDIVNLAASQADKLKKYAADKKVTIKIDNHLSSPEAATDPQLLGIALSELIDNAIKFNKVGGIVHIDLNDFPNNGSSSFSISITDQGCGIAPEAREHLFESFTQGEDHLTRHYNGLGTGLFLAKRAVEIMGASIAVESDKGKGSKFTLNIPVKESVCPK
jgi:two-component system phosphate regulon sensor histidine kinase PhoR